jgi:hypothetical protein
MDSWNQELERIENKSFRMYERLARAVEELQSILESLYGTDQAAVGEEPQQRQQLEELKRIAEAKQRECNSEQKEVYASLSKFSKSVDKVAQQLLEGACCSCTKLAPDLVNQAICQHLFRKGLFTVGEQFADESGIIFVDNDFTEPIKELYDIVSAINRYELEPAIR